MAYQPPRPPNDGLRFLGFSGGILALVIALGIIVPMVLIFFCCCGGPAIIGITTPSPPPTF